MTEADWLVCTDPTPMLEFVRDKVSDRKLRLFAVACCRRTLDVLEVEVRDGLDVAERRADGQASGRQLAQARQIVCLLAYHHPKGHLAAESSGSEARHSAAMAVLAALCDRASNGVGQHRWRTGGRDENGHSFGVGSDFGSDYHAANVAETLDDRKRERKAQARILRCIFGNPFRPVNIDPSWLGWNDGTVVKLAQSIYDDRAFDRLPILADALEEAGCANQDILAHCHQSGEHVRGCWVVDLLLGKE